MERPPTLDVRGKTHGLFEQMGDTGAHVFSVDDVGLGEARTCIGRHISLMGNVQPAQMLLNGTPEWKRKRVSTSKERRGVPKDPSWLRGARCRGTHPSRTLKR